MTRQCYRGRPRASRSPRVSRDAGHIRSFCYKLQAEAIRGCNLDQIARLRWQRAEVPSVAAFQTQACCCLRDACITYAWRKEDAACMLVGSPKSVGRGRNQLESHVSSAGRAVYHSNAQGGMDLFAHAAGSCRCASLCQVETAWSRLVRVVRLAPDRSQGLRGGMRRMGATCTDAQT